MEERSQPHDSAALHRLKKIMLPNEKQSDWANEVGH